MTAQAGKTATRARDAATKVAPSRLPGIKTAVSDPAKAGRQEVPPSKKVSEANDSASKKAAS